MSPSPRLSVTNVKLSLDLPLSICNEEDLKAFDAENIEDQADDLVDGHILDTSPPTQPMGGKAKPRGWHQYFPS